MQRRVQRAGRRLNAFCAQPFKRRRKKRGAETWRLRFFSDTLRWARRLQLQFQDHGFAEVHYGAGGGWGEKLVHRNPFSSRERREEYFDDHFKRAAYSFQPVLKVSLKRIQSNLQLPFHWFLLIIWWVSLWFRRTATVKAIYMHRRQKLKNICSLGVENIESHWCFFGQDQQISISSGVLFTFQIARQKSGPERKKSVLLPSSAVRVMLRKAVHAPERCACQVKKTFRNLKAWICTYEVCW